MICSLRQALTMIILMGMFVGQAVAQPTLPQRSITVIPTQGINFGTFCLTGGAGGTVVIGWNGDRSATGSIALLMMDSNAHEAIFAIKLCEGRIVQMTFDSSVSLNNTKGGTTLVLIPGPTDKGLNGSSFATNSDCNSITLLRMGGTLRVPPTALSGNYTGYFGITFNQQ